MISNHHDRQNFLYIRHYFKNHPIATLSHKISIRVKQDLWRDKFGNNTEGECWVCCDPISCFNFQAGHVVPFVHGGSNDVSNLRPICSVCNQSMGAQDLRSFVLKNFKHKQHQSRGYLEFNNMNNNNQVDI